MKGLLIKDFKLLKGRMSVFYIIIVIAVSMVVFSKNFSFLLGYMPFVFSIFALSTISYDEYDNGYAFLFTLPFSRTGYVAEKYCFILMFGGGSMIIATILTIVFGVSRGTISLSETATYAVFTFAILVVLQAVIIPLQLKFGAERGKIALIIVWGILFVIGVAAIKALKLLGIDIMNIIDNLPMVSMGVMTALILIAAIIILLISMKISSSIMNRKEF